MEEIEKAVSEFIVENFLFGDEDGVPEPEESFLEMRLIDSTGVLELVLFLETNYEIKIADAELTPENLDSLRKIAAFVTKKCA
ncbi:MAG: acyl carrier protein [Deltaproteobacteria bacterium RIFOXYA12_FULL_58_15]|nr:MAG: acyl carrier protein [Deltaproteobacteria bacterium RIFOXYA12_FULL_58_15]OGR14829.1 MAG: acyl carrier protein [Deltaproteobacteria bacterium RIFOXYB12_FULL_58_9]